MYIYNTLSGKKESLDTALGGKKNARLFVCGPTVYDLPHLGHARIAVFFDFVKKYLKSVGYKVKYLQNITDVDDRIIERAKEEGRKSEAVAKENEKSYLKIMKVLGVNSVDEYPRASAHIKEIIGQIQRLMTKGFAYQTPHGVYFEIKKFPEYGKLSRQNLNDLRPGWRIEPDPEKKDPLDFALWKFQKHGYEPTRGKPVEPSWDSPWGKGRPGWHIEDTAITEKYFGPAYDLHGGGMDLKFPHHESEIAQQAAAAGIKAAEFVKIWLHVGFLMVNGEKMSKSLKNFITVEDFLKRYPAEILRFIFFQHHYRSPIDYSNDVAQQSAAALEGIAQFLRKLELTAALNNSPKPLSHNTTIVTGFKGLLSEDDKNFQAALADDFNTSAAISIIFKLIGSVNEKIWHVTPADAKSISKWVKNCLELFGIELKLPKIPVKIAKLAKSRELFRVHKQFDQSDDLRKQIEALGYTIEDTPCGPFLWPRQSY